MLPTRHSKGEPRMMKNLIRGMIMVSALAGAVSLSAQTASPSAQTATPDAQVAPPAAAPTADEIVQKHLAAIGGKEAISQVKSLSMVSSAQIMGSDAPGTTVIMDGVGYRTDTDFNGTKMVQCYNDKGGWTVNPMAGGPDPTPMPDDQYNFGKSQIFVGGPLYDYAAKGSKVELIGKDEKTYKIKLTTKDNIESVYVIDASTYFVKSLAAKGKMQDQDVEITTSFSDYRKTDAGYVVPYAIDVDLGGQFTFSVAIKKVELNKTIDPAIFAMPKPAPASEPAKPAASPAPQ
jgi:hypothetical protein